MRVGVVTTSYPRWPGDYAGCFVADRVAELEAAGATVEIIAAGERGRCVALDPQVTRVPADLGLFYGAGAPETLEGAGAPTWLAAASFTARLSAAVAQRAAALDVIESHWLVPSALAASAAAPAVRRVAFAHSGDVALLERMPFGRTLARRLARDGTDVRFVTAALRDRFAALAGRTCGRVHPLEVRSTAFVRRRRPDPVARSRLGIAGPTVLAVGRLVPIKNHRALVVACARLRLGHAGLDKLSLVILGDGPERARLMDLSRRLDVPLRLPGFVSRPIVADWLAAVDVFAHTSVRLPNGRREGAPLAIREAVAVGVPIVEAERPAVIAAELGQRLASGHAFVNAA